MSAQEIKIVGSRVTVDMECPSRNCPRRRLLTKVTLTTPANRGSHRNVFCPACGELMEYT